MFTKSVFARLAIAFCDIILQIIIVIANETNDIQTVQCALHNIAFMYPNFKTKQYKMFSLKRFNLILTNRKLIYESAIKNVIDTQVSRFWFTNYLKKFRFEMAIVV